MEINDLIRGLAGQMDPQLFLQAVKAECFPDGAASDAQLLMLLAVAAKRDLDPLAKEIFAFVNKKGKMTIGTGIDGWVKIAHRQPTFRGYRATEVRNEDGSLVAIRMEMFRSDWERPGEYTAYLAEWNQKTDNWIAMPTHRLFDKAWHECARFTFAITDLVDREDIERIREADAREESRPEPQRVIEHQPIEPANFIQPEQREKVEVHSNSAQPTGHLKVQVELPGEKSSTAEAGAGAGRPNAAMNAIRERDDAPQESASAGNVAAQESGARAQNAETAPAPGRRGRPPGSKNKPKTSTCWKCDKPSMFAASVRDGATIEYCSSGHEPTGEDLKRQADERQPNASAGAPPAPENNAQETAPAGVATDTSADQAAAGLEHIDPSEHPLETFIRIRDVPQRRVDMALSKYGAMRIADLTDEQKAAVLGVFEKSYKLTEASNAAH